MEDASAGAGRFPRLLRIAAIALAALAAAALPARAQNQPVAGQNVNMVSGTTWPGGDPFLQRQNEPSLAVSSRNSLHLLAGANDYRTVDLPVADTIPGSLAGDAWLGVFKSLDGGQSWQSYLLPGYPQDTSAAGMASPLKAYSAAADPTVRAGTGGLFYYSGIAFNRGTNNGGVFVSTFFDGNSKENNSTLGNDAIQYQKTVLVDTGTSGQFLDKTWVAVDVPRAGAGTCTFTSFGQTQTVKAGNVYLAWTRFTGSQSTKIMFSRSQDCGATWSKPDKISESSRINQGTSIAIDPATGKIYVAWRQFATSSNSDAILVARSDDFGNKFFNKDTFQVATIAPFDQANTSTRFRTNALPSIVASVDGAGTSRVHVAWAQRNASNQDAQVVVSTSSDSGATWGAPVPVDAAPLADDSGGSFARGHQFMPQMTFGAGRLMVLYYDQRLDHTLGLFAPQDNPFLGVYTRTQALRGELTSSGGQGKVFTLFVDDDASILTQRRHTIDLRVAEALPAATSFTSASVSQYRMGLFAPDSSGTFYDDQDLPIGNQPTSLYQLQVNAPNLPMFSLGTLPFLGDYIDIAAPSFVANTDGSWSFNTSSSNPPVFYAAWTDNRDVVPPVVPGSGGLVDWTKYTPPYSATNVGDGTSNSIYDPTQKVPACLGAYTGSRNQNIYFSRITEGLLVASPQDAKPLSATFQRGFVVTLQNQTNQDRTFTLTVTPQTGVWASFIQLPPGQPLTLNSPKTTTLTVTVPARSGAARPVFAFSSNPAGRMTVNVVESGSNSINLSGSIVLNPEGSVSPLAQPDGTTADIGSVEVYTPSFQIWNSANPNPFVNISSPSAGIAVQNISNQNISNADPAIQNISNQNISNQNISNQNISNQNISNPSPAIQNISNQNISNQNISNTTAANQNISNQNISNQNISNQNISNTPITDATYAMTNLGNTAHSYRVALYGTNPNPNTPLQVIVTKNSSTPVAVGCELQSLPQSVVLARTDGAPIASSLTGAGSATDPNIPDSSSSNATVQVGPGETVFVTIRGALTPDQMLQLTRGLTPVVTAHGANTNGTVNDFTALLFIQTVSGVLPAAIVGVPYNGTGYQFQSAGGSGTITWTATGTLPTGLTFSSSGLLSGTPSGAGSFTFDVKASDSSATPQTSTQTISMTVAARNTSTAISFGANPIVVGQATPVTVTVTDTQVGGMASVPTGPIALAGTGLSASTCNLVPTTAAASACSVTETPVAAGTVTIGANFTATAAHLTSGATTGLTVNPAPTTTALTSDANPAVWGQVVTLKATVSVNAPGAGTPTGTVSFSDGATVLGTATLSGGIASITVSSLSVASHSITAAYGGDPAFSAGTSPALSQTVNKASTSTAVVSTSGSSPSVFGQSVTFTATVSVTAPGAGTPSGTVTFLDGAATLGTGTLASGKATFTTTSLSVATHPVTVSYAGDAGFASGVSSVLSHVVNQAATSTSISSSATPTVYGQAVIFTATVSATAPGAGTPSGTVTFFDGATALGPGTLASGKATFTSTSLPVGTHSITASYGADASFAGSVSTALSQVVNQTATSTAISSSANPAVYGQPVTFVAAVSVTAPGTGTPSGTVTFFDGATSIGAATLSGGSASVTTSSLAGGTHTVSVIYAGDSSFAGSTSGALSQVVNRTNTSTAIGSSPNPSSFGQGVTFTATVTSSAGTPTGTVTFFDGATSIGSATLSGGSGSVTTSALLGGTHTVTAVYAGDSNFAGSTSGALSQVVNRSSTSTAIGSSSNPSAFGQPVTFTATVTSTGGTPTGTVTFFDGSTSIGTANIAGGSGSITTSALTGGTHSMTAVYAGDSNFAGSTSGALAQVVNRSNTSTGILSSPNPSTPGQAVTFTATVTPSAGATGTVTFFDGAATLGTVPLSGGGASLTTSTLAAGTHSVKAVYSGDTNFAGSTSGALSQVVNPASTTTSIVSSVNPSAFGQSVKFTATVTSGAGTPTGTVTFLDGAATIGTATLSGGTASFTTSALVVGSHSIKASYGGNPSFAGSTSAVLSQVVNKASTSTVVTSGHNPSDLDDRVTFTATVSVVAPGAGSPTGSVGFFDGATQIGTGTLSAGKATFLSAPFTLGTHSITAKYLGDSNFATSTSPVLSQVVKTSDGD